MINNQEAEQRKLMADPANRELHPRTREFYNSRTRKIENDDHVAYLFDYHNYGPRVNGEEVLTWKELKDLKDRKQWHVIRHPMVLNFLDEKLLGRAKIYMAHILAYLLFLLLLSSYIFQKTFVQDILATSFLLVFFFALVVKGATKLMLGNVSKWFVASYLFNIVTYTATFLFIWTPQLFAYNDYNPELKRFITWLLPIIAIISAWINFLYILRKSPYGIYILMMNRILYTFSQIAIIWVPTLLAFAFAFHLVMRNSGHEPWESSDAFKANATIGSKMLAILQAITKTSTMMIGEVDADSVLGRKEWIPNLLLLGFEITTVILLMNLMISLAVGDVNDLRHSAQAKLLEIKISFVIEALSLAELCECLPKVHLLHRQRTNNVLVVGSDFEAFSAYKNFTFADDLPDNSSSEASKRGNFFGARANGTGHESGLMRHNVHPTQSAVDTGSRSRDYASEAVPTGEQYTSSGNTATTKFYERPENAAPAENSKNGVAKVYHLHFPKGLGRGLRLDKFPMTGRDAHVRIEGAVIELVESVASGIPDFKGTIEGRQTDDVGTDPEGFGKKFARWFIGMNWTCLLDL